MPVIINNKGLSLVEVLISIGLSSIVAISLAVMLSQTSLMEASLKSKDSFNQLSSELAAATKNSQICTAYGLKLTPSTVFNIATAATSTGQPVQVNMGGIPVGNGAAVPPFNLASSDLRITNVKSLGVTNTAGEFMYQGLLKISAVRKDSLTGGISRERTISSLIFSLNSSQQISNCSEKTTADFQACTVDPTTQQCMGAMVTNQACPANQIAIGYSAGAIQCAAMDTACAPTEIATGILNGRIICATPPAPGPPPPLPAPTSNARFVQIAYDPVSICPPDPRGCYANFNNPALIASTLGIPECTTPQLGQKCFMRSKVFFDATYGIDLTNYRVNILYGVPYF